MYGGFRVLCRAYGFSWVFGFYVRFCIVAMGFVIGFYRDLCRI